MRFSVSRLRVTPPEPVPDLPLWATACGPFGDVLAALGRLQALLREHGLPAAGVLYWGPYADAVGLLSAQPHVAHVAWKQPGDREGHYRAAVRRATEGASGWEEEWAEGTAVPLERLVRAHPSQDPFDGEELVLPEGLRLPDWATDWAWQGAMALGEFTLIQPYSLANVAVSDHWPHWEALLQRIGRAVLAGAGAHPVLALPPEILDWRGRTPTMLHVYALVQWATQVVTTASSIALWCAATGTRAVVLPHRRFTPGNNYYRLCDRSPVRIMDCETTTAAALEALA